MPLSVDSVVPIGAGQLLQGTHWLEPLRDAMVVTDPQGRIVFFNRSAERLYQYPRAEVFGRLSTEVFRTEFPGVPEDVRAHVCRVGSWEGELVQYRRDGSRVLVRSRWVAVSLEGAAAEFVLESNSDTAESKTVELELRASEERLRSATDVAKIVLFEYGGSLGRIEWQGSASLIATMRRVVEGGRVEEIFERIHAADREAVRKAIGRLLEFENVAMAFRVSQDAGHQNWYEIACRRSDSGEGPVRVTGAVVDATERKAMDQRLAVAGRMELVGRLAGGIAHDFNNLLMAIRGFADALLVTADASGTPCPELEGITHAASRGAALTRQLLGFARRQITEPRIINLNDTIRENAVLLRQLLTHDIELEFELEESLWATRLDPAQLEQVMMNLVVNARDVLESQGKVQIATQNRVLDGQAALALDLEPGEYVLLSVSDDGPGMAEEILEHVFEPFFTTKEPACGTGIGLATCQGIATQSGGAIDVESKLGCGARFDVWWPRCAAAETVPARPAIVPHPDSPADDSVLVVDDDAMVLRVVAAALRRAKYRVIEASGGAEALSVLERSGSAIALLLTDVRMPGVDGITLASRARTIAPNLPILFMSGHTDAATPLGHFLASGAPLIQKPFSSEHLVGTVAGLLSRANAPF